MRVRAHSCCLPVAQLRKKFLPDVEAIVRELREQRMNLIQTAAQFEFCYIAALSMLNDPSWKYE